MKKFLSLILAVFLSFFLLTACGTNQKPHTTPSAGAAYSSEKEDGGITVKKDGTYTDKNHVAAYIHKYKTLPSNYITKKEARKLGWKEEGTLDRVAPGKSIGGDRFGNYEKLLPEKSGRAWKECDIDYVKGNRNAKRICYSDDGLIYYSPSHYKYFERLY